MADENNDQGVKTFTQEEVNGLIASEKRTWQAKHEEALAEKDKAIEGLTKEKESVSALAAQSDERLKEMEKTLNERTHEALRYKVGLDAGLPTAVVTRLVGDDEESLKADAEELAGLLKKPGNLAGGPPGESIEDKPDMNSMIREAAGHRAVRPT